MWRRIRRGIVDQRAGGEHVLAGRLLDIIDLVDVNDDSTHDDYSTNDDDSTNDFIDDDHRVDDLVAAVDHR